MKNISQGAYKRITNTVLLLLHGIKQLLNEVIESMPYHPTLWTYLDFFIILFVCGKKYIHFNVRVYPKLLQKCVLFF